MALIVKNKNREWREEKTTKLQLESLNEFAKILGYKSKDVKLPIKGYKRLRYNYISLHTKTNYISFRDMISLHNFVTKDMYENSKEYFDIENGYLKNQKTLPKYLKLNNKIIFNDHILFLKMINYSYNAKLVEKVKLQKNKNYDLKIQTISNIVKITNKGSEYLKENDYLFRKEDIIINTNDNYSHKIKEIELYRDGGSFSFEYKKNTYEVMVPLYVLTCQNKVIRDINLVEEILESFDKILLENEIEKSRIIELLRYSHTLKIIKDSNS